MIDTILLNTTSKDVEYCLYKNPEISSPISPDNLIYPPGTLLFKLTNVTDLGNLCCDAIDLSYIIHITSPISELINIDATTLEKNETLQTQGFYTYYIETIVKEHSNPNNLSTSKSDNYHFTICENESPSAPILSIQNNTIY